MTSLAELPDAALAAILQQVEAATLLRSVALTNKRLGTLATDSEVIRRQGFSRKAWKAFRVMHRLPPPPLPPTADGTRALQLL